MPIVKFLNGDIVEYEQKDIAELSLAIIESLNQEEKEEKIVELIPNENKSEDDIDFFAFFSYKKILILNLTQKNYFSYERQYGGDTGYNSTLRDLFEQDLSGFSHWQANDHIVFVPNHINNYVTAVYGQLKI